MGSEMCIRDRAVPVVQVGDVRMGVPLHLVAVRVLVTQGRVAVVRVGVVPVVVRVGVVPVVVRVLVVVHHCGVLVLVLMSRAQDQRDPHCRDQQRKDLGEGGRLSHDHEHTHDDGHHTHTHDGDPCLRHQHPHSHEAQRHTHPHVPDLHHRHSHER